MLANLDNEVIFKKAFTDKIVFKAFVKDVLGIEFEVGKIETEKRFKPKIGRVDFRLDIFAESVDKRIIVEIQRIEYDYNFDRFLHYFLMTIAEQQKSSENYAIKKTVYVIVVLTEPYTINEKNGLPVRDELLLLKINPKTIEGTERDLYGHEFVCLNPNHPHESTPAAIRDWLNLIYQSIHHPENPKINRKNKAISRAASLIEFENLSPEELEQRKIVAMTREKALIKEKMAKESGKIEGKIEEKIDIAKKMLRRGTSIDIIAEDTGLSVEQITALK